MVAIQQRLICFPASPSSSAVLDSPTRRYRRINGSKLMDRIEIILDDGYRGVVVEEGVFSRSFLVTFLKEYISSQRNVLPRGFLG